MTRKRNPDSYRRVISLAQRRHLRALRTIHGHAATSTRGHSRTYQSWMSMKERCDSPKHKSYEYYGGRGIGYCRRWDKFVNFLDDMGERPAGMTLGRIRHDRDYSPSNCEWQTHAEQANNRRNSRFLSFDGKRQTLQQWADFLGMSAGAIGHRLLAGWSVERALTQPPKIQKNSRYYAQQAAA